VDWQNLGGFRKELSSFEDVEFAYRALKLGMKLEFNPKALATHSHPLQLEDRLNRAVSYTQTVPLLYQMHPELQGQIAHLIDKEPVNWKSDPFVLILRKSLRRLLACKPIRELNRQVVKSISHKPAGDRMVKFFYWKLIGSYQYIGLQEGIKRYGWTADN
jgi:GT2 family glycosyltransferase